jgi:hypothetical protein
VVIAVIFVRMMWAAIDQVVDVIGVRHCLMAALRAVFVTRRVTEVLRHRRTPRGVLLARFNGTPTPSRRRPESRTPFSGVAALSADGR